MKLLSKFITLIFLMSLQAQATQPNPPGQVKVGEKPTNEAYLFAHMTHSDYGRLYYSVSLDGLHWKRMNGNKRVFSDYQGHPDIVKGPSGRYFIAGNASDASPDINIWSSLDLITWTKHTTFTPNLKSTPNYSKALQRIGAPKLFFDKASAQFVLTWHTPHLEGTPTDVERYWNSQRTLYVTSEDLLGFSSPKMLFDWDIGTIDVFIRQAEGKYWAIVKDERYPTLDWVTGKTIRIASSDSLLGPYTKLSAPISPNFYEAPMLIPSPNGKAWYMYYEQYPGISYGVSVADKLTGPWYKLSGNTHFADWDKYSMPAELRHGAMMTISRKEYDQLVTHFGTN